MEYFDYFFWYALLILGGLFVVLSIDDVLIDCIFWVRRIYRFIRYYKRRRLTLEILNTHKEQRIALMVPCWHEETVIADMLRHNLRSIQYKNFDIFVGTYPNDIPTQQAVRSVSSEDARVHCVVNSAPGPTTKSQNMNEIIAYIKAMEKRENFEFDIFVLHDSEDVIHPLSFKLYNYLIPSKEFVQTPVIPLEVSLWNFTHWVYNDEFAENHSKDLIVREAIGGHVPSAGVGTAISKMALQKLFQANNGTLVQFNTLTEDYHFSFLIHKLNLKAIFVTHHIERMSTRKRWYFFGPEIPVIKKELVATNSLFPLKYLDAVRQRARWILGISFQEWYFSGWHGGRFVSKLTRFRDRKAVFTYFIGGLGYIVFIYWLLRYLWSRYFSINNPLFSFLEQHPLAYILIYYCTFLAVNRIIERIIATTHIYGILPGITSPLRIPLGNIINSHSIIIALHRFIMMYFRKKEVTWVKTSNRFPNQDQLKKIRRKLGDILIDKGLINNEQLQLVLKKQQENPNENFKLGFLLKQNYWINDETLLEALCEQYQLPLINVKNHKILPFSKTPFIDKNKLISLLKKNAYLTAIDDNTITVVISDPSDENLKNEIYHLLNPYKVKFLIGSPEDIRQKFIEFLNENGNKKSTL